MVLDSTSPLGTSLHRQSHLLFRNWWVVPSRAPTYAGLQRGQKVPYVLFRLFFVSDFLLSDYLPLVNLLGLYYQIRDDYLNLQSDEYQKNKSFAEGTTSCSCRCGVLS